MKTRNSIEFPRTLREIIEHPDFRPFGSESDDWLRGAERLQRCNEAAEHGAEGSTHREIMDDWREFLERLEREAHCKAWAHGRVSTEIERRVSAITAEIDACEAWHEKSGSIDEQVG